MPVFQTSADYHTLTQASRSQARFDLGYGIPSLRDSIKHFLSPEGTEYHSPGRSELASGRPGLGQRFIES